MRGTDTSRYKEIADPEEVDLFWKAGLLHYQTREHGPYWQFTSMHDKYTSWYTPRHAMALGGWCKFYVLTEED